MLRACGARVQGVGRGQGGGRWHVSGGSGTTANYLNFLTCSGAEGPVWRAGLVGRSDNSGNIVIGNSAVSAPGGHDNTILGNVAGMSANSADYNIVIGSGATSVNRGSPDFDGHQIVLGTSGETLYVAGGFAWNTICGVYTDNGQRGPQLIIASPATGFIIPKAVSLGQILTIRWTTPAAYTNTITTPSSVSPIWPLRGTASATTWSPSSSEGIASGTYTTVSLVSDGAAWFVTSYAAQPP